MHQSAEVKLKAIEAFALTIALYAAALAIYIYFNKPSDAADMLLWRPSAKQMLVELVTAAFALPIVVAANHALDISAKFAFNWSPIDWVFNWRMLRKFGASGLRGTVNINVWLALAVYYILRLTVALGFGAAN